MEALSTETAISEIPGSERQTGSIRDAARTLATFRHQRDNPETAAPERQEATVPNQSGEEPVTATAETQPSGEQTEAIDTAETPPIAPPKSWTKEAAERFASLPRETQEYLAQREDERDRDVSRRHNEAADQRKAIDAERVKVDQARQQYETALPALMATLQQQQAGEFADIKTYEDLNSLARTDWPRWIAYQQHQANIERVRQEVTAAQSRQAHEHQEKFREYLARENDLVREKLPDMADPEKAQKLHTRAISLLKGVGFSDDELGQMGRGERGLAVQDHRFQLLVHDALLYREMKVAARTAQTKPVPPVQRPGVTQGKSAQQDAVVQNLTKRLNQTGSLKDATRLITERRKLAG